VPLPGQCGGYLQRFCQTCFDGNQIGEAGAQALAASPHLAGLTTLDLSDIRIGDVGAQALAATTQIGHEPLPL
jgi:hypothetical protein